MANAIIEAEVSGNAILLTSTIRTSKEGNNRESKAVSAIAVVTKTTKKNHALSINLALIFVSIKKNKVANKIAKIIDAIEICGFISGGCIPYGISGVMVLLTITGPSGVSIVSVTCFGA